MLENTLSFKIKRRCIKKSMVLTALLLLFSFDMASALVPGAVQGYIYSRSIIASDNGNPYWAAYDESGNIAEELGEATGNKDVSKVFIVGGETYRSFTELWQTTLEQYNDSPIQPEVITKAQFQGLTFITVSGVGISAPDLKDNSNFVVVRPPNQIVNGEYQYILNDPSQIILMEAAFDFSQPIGDGVRSMLISREDGSTVVSSNNNIGFETAFFGDRGEYDPNTYNLRDHDDPIWGPVSGVEVESLLSKGITGEDGNYRVYVEMFPCDLVVTQMWNMTAVLYSASFNPRRGRRYPYFMSKQYSPPCWSWSWYGVGIWGLGLRVPNSFYFPPQRYMDFPVDLMVLNGYAKMINGVTVNDEPTTYKSSGADLDKQASPIYDYDGDGATDFALLGSMIDNPSQEPDAPEKIFSDATDGVDDEDLVQGVYFSSVGQIYTGPDGAQPDLIRTADYQANFAHEGLASNLNVQDLANTDLYIFRASTGEIVAERSGLAKDEVDKIKEIGVDEDRGQFFYAMSIRGPRDGIYRNTSRSLTGRYDENGEFQSWDEAFKRWQTFSGMRPELHERQSDHLRPGELVRIIAINRTTGYMGSASTVLTNSTGITNTGTHLSVQLPDITMLPPNLKVWAERHYKIEKGLTKNEERTYTVGNEGGAMKNDEWVAIHTEWLDHNGFPLPKGLEDFGFTGRVGRITGQDVVSEAGGSLSQFAIKPGKHLQVVRVAGQDIANEHLYVQVSGEPKERLADFSSVNRAAGAPAGPDFNSSGVHEGKLKHRPDRYVPIRVPVWDELLSVAGERAYKNAIKEDPSLADTLEEPKPYYHWLYRPEFQFSTYDLNVTEINRTYTTEEGEEQTENVLNSSEPLLTAGDSLIEVLFGLTGNETAPPLDTFNGDKQLILAIGEQEIALTLGQNQTISMDNPEHFSHITAEDFLSISLYLNGDANNLLWQFAFKTMDMDVDSNNDNAFEEPDRSIEEEELETEDGELGKYFAVNDGDVNENGIRDYVEFDYQSNDIHFVPLVIDFPSELNFAESKIKFTYSASDPNQLETVTDPDTEEDIDVPAAGNLRLWLKDANEARNKNTIGNGGDFVENNKQYTPNELGFSESSIEGKSIILYIEGVKPADDFGNQIIEFEVIDESL